MSRKPGCSAAVMCMNSDPHIFGSFRFVPYTQANCTRVMSQTHGHIRSAALVLLVSANLLFCCCRLLNVCLWGESGGEADQAVMIPQDFSSSRIMGTK